MAACVLPAFSQPGSNYADASVSKAEAVVTRAVQKLGRERYLQSKTSLGKGNYSTVQDGVAASFSYFVDVIVFPDKERTEFKQGGIKTVQTNFGDQGWTFDGADNRLKDQSKEAVDSFRRGIRTSMDYFLRGFWRQEGGKVTYIGKREASLGRRNEAVKLTYPDGLVVEFEFSADDGMPAKALYKRKNSEGEEVKEEDRYAQFIDAQGVMSPFIIDHYVNGKHTSRINYDSIEYNISVPDTIFKKPGDIKELKKDLKLQ